MRNRRLGFCFRAIVPALLLSLPVAGAQAPAGGEQRGARGGQPAAALSKGLNPRAAAAVERVGRSPLHHPSPLRIGQTEG